MILVGSYNEALYCRSYRGLQKGMVLVVEGGMQREDQVGRRSCALWSPGVQKEMRCGVPVLRRRCGLVCDRCRKTRHRNFPRHFGREGLGFLLVSPRLPRPLGLGFWFCLFSSPFRVLGWVCRNFLYPLQMEDTATTLAQAQPRYCAHSRGLLASRDGPCVYPTSQDGAFTSK